jgi:hypothetical protein
MSNKDFSSVAGSSIITSTSGSMSGIIDYLHSGDGEQVEFKSRIVARYMAGTNTMVFAEMTMPGFDNGYRVYIILPGSEPATGSYTVGSGGIDVNVDIVDHGHLQAKSGTLILQNHTPIRKLTGAIVFETIPHDAKCYRVQMVFDIYGPAAGSELDKSN